MAANDAANPVEPNTDKAARVECVRCHQMVAPMQCRFARDDGMCPSDKTISIGELDVRPWLGDRSLGCPQHPDRIVNVQQLSIAQRNRTAFCLVPQLIANNSCAVAQQGVILLAAKPNTMRGSA